MALSKDKQKKYGRRIHLDQFAECWAGIGLMVGIWAVTFGIIASGILMR